MDAFLTRLSYHATSYAIRSCIALTSRYVIKQGAKLLQSVEHDALRLELGQLQRRLARKIELISPILESIELRYTRGDSALETIVRTARGLQDDIHALGERLKHATPDAGTPDDASGTTKAKSPKASAARQLELVGIIGDIKELITNIDDTIPLINLWVSAIGGVQSPASSFSPSRLLQASMLVNVADTQFILDPTQPMQIGPDFTLSLYMLFRGHAPTHGEAEEPYGIEEGQRKPMWQEVMHKARVRLLRVPLGDGVRMTNGEIDGNPRAHYSYRLQVVEDLDDGRLHAFDDQDGHHPAAYDGLPLAGIREFIPIHQISKMFYADVGKILNIHNDEGASGSPVLLLKRDVNAIPVHGVPIVQPPHDSVLAIEDEEEGNSSVSEDSLSEGDTQDDIDSQLRREMGWEEGEKDTATIVISEKPKPRPSNQGWAIPQDLDPEWIALEVFDFDESDTDSDTSTTLDDDDDDDDNELSVLGNGAPRIATECRPRHVARSSVDRNLITQFNRMSIASSRPSSRDSHSHTHSCPPHSRSPDETMPPPPPVSAITKNTTSTPPPTPAANGNVNTTNNRNYNTHISPSTLLERSPFGAIRTSLSLLEMLLRLASLQEFEQTTHLAIPDHVLRFYLDESVSTSGLRGKERWDAAAEAERKVGFDPYADPS
ncbi:Ran-binding-domain-containing protein [Xylariaceae sp. FL0594]|nr:Ran-binding-domain-containing protein [Xylariaceae sp. FL0594]